MIKSPLKNTQTTTKSLSFVLSKIPAGSVVDTFLLFTGEFETMLSQYDRFVVSHTNKYAVFEFWLTISNQRNRDRMYKILTSESFRFHPKIYPILQEKWVEYKDPVIRSCFFFLLNQSSETGQISSGELNPGPINPLALADLKSYNIKQGIEFIWDTHDEFTDAIGADLLGDYILIRPGKFSYNFFEHGKTEAHDVTKVNHQKLKDALEKSNKKFLVVYDADNRIPRFFKGHNITFIDKYGRVTQKQESALEVIVANF